MTQNDDTQQIKIWQNATQLIDTGHTELNDGSQLYIFTLMKSVIILYGIMFSVIVLNAVMLTGDMPSAAMPRIIVTSVYAECLVTHDSWCSQNILQKTFLSGLFSFYACCCYWYKSFYFVTDR
jgi:hypothetical protein